MQQVAGGDGAGALIIVTDLHTERIGVIDNDGQLAGVQAVSGQNELGRFRSTSESVGCAQQHSKQSCREQSGVADGWAQNCAPVCCLCWWHMLRARRGKANVKLAFVAELVRLVTQDLLDPGDPVEL